MNTIMLKVAILIEIKIEIDINVNMKWYYHVKGHGFESRLGCHFRENNNYRFYMELHVLSFAKGLSSNLDHPSEKNWVIK